MVEDDNEYSMQMAGVSLMICMDSKPVVNRCKYVKNDHENTKEKAANRETTRQTDEINTVKRNRPRVRKTEHTRQTDVERKS